jgi:hypothetical protein
LLVNGVKNRLNQVCTGGGKSRVSLYRGQGPLRVRSSGEQEDMTTFDERKDAFERKFAHDEEQRFKALARRNKLLGLWVAEKLGKTGPDADAYARSVVLADFEEAGHEDVFRKVRGDLDASVSDTEIRTQMDAFLAQAAQEVQSG